MPEKHRPHTPITSRRQKGLFGAAYAAKKAGEPAPSYVPRSLMKQPKSVLKSHLKESAGKNLPMRSRMRKHNPGSRESGSPCCGPSVQTPM